MGKTVRLRLPCQASTPARARREIACWLNDFDCLERVDDVQLVVSELVTNAVLHAGTDVEIWLDVDPKRLVVAVSDFGPGLPERRDAGPEDDHGRGLNLVDSLSSAWGVEIADPGTTVWCSLDRPKPLRARVASVPHPG